MKSLLIPFLVFCVALTATGCHPPPPEIFSIRVVLAEQRIPAGISTTAKAQRVYSDGHVVDLDASTLLLWTSSDQRVATVVSLPDGTAKVTALKPGSAVITVNAAGSPGAANLDVTDALLLSLAVSPSSASVPVGLTQQFTATGGFSDNTTRDLSTSVTWASSDPAKATVSTKGLATGLSAGRITVTATSGTHSSTASLEVSDATIVAITVTPNTVAIPLHGKQQLTAQALLSDGTLRDVTATASWATNNSSVATIDATGLATGVAVGGPVTLTATQNNVSGTAQLTVTGAVLTSISISPAVVSVPAGRTQQFTATGTYSDGTTRDISTSVTWTTSNASVATINAAGLATAGTVGATATITATLGSVSGTAQLTVTASVLTAITVTPATASVPAGRTQQFTATGSYSNGTTSTLTNSVTWTSSNVSIATVSSTGLGTGVAVGGPVTLIATLGTVSGSTQLTVTPPVLTAITVTPATASVLPGTTQQFTATGSYSNGTTSNLTNSVTWASGNASIATVSSTGLGTGVAAGGPVTITAAFGTVSGSAQLSVMAPTLTGITMTPATASVAPGTTQQFKATGSFNNSTTGDVTNSVTWTSSNNSIATVSSIGLSTGVAAGGPITITASSGSVSGSAQLTVTGWSSISPMSIARSYHTATLLPSGKVLVVGGYSLGSPDGMVASAELYDPATGSWSSAGSMAAPRYVHTATLLPSGKVLVTGGISRSLQYIATAELYDPATNSWSPAGSMSVNRAYHTATRLSTGKVLIAGGVSLEGGGALSTAELYNPVTNSWSKAGSMASGCAGNPATLLTTGRVLIEGEWYDPLSDAWYPTGLMLTTGTTATLLPSGKVLVAGGTDSSAFTAEWYDPASNSWSAAGSMASERELHTATLLSTGKVLVTGGRIKNSNAWVDTATSEVYDPTSDTWSPAPSMASARIGHTATLLPSGKVLVLGGGSLASGELYTP